MKIGVNLKIDVTKLDKTRFFKAKSGAIYADLTVFIDPSKEDQYGYNGGITQALTKEERESNVKPNFVGNSKVFWCEQKADDVNNDQSCYESCDESCHESCEVPF